MREDGREDDVFSLIGPKKYDVPWKELEQQGWIADGRAARGPRCALPDELRMEYAIADDAREVPHRRREPGQAATCSTQLRRAARATTRCWSSASTSTSSTRSPQHFERAADHRQDAQRASASGCTTRFRDGEITLLVVSKVANFAIDLPDANVAIQVSGTFGSRQEEAQRLGRILRPKRDGSSAHFYTLVTRDTRDQEFAANRQLFLTEQGYRYEILYEDELLAASPRPAPATARPRQTADGHAGARRPSGDGERDVDARRHLAGSPLDEDDGTPAMRRRLRPGRRLATRAATSSVRGSRRMGLSANVRGTWRRVDGVRVRLRPASSSRPARATAHVSAATPARCCCTGCARRRPSMPWHAPAERADAATTVTRDPAAAWQLAEPESPPPS